MLLLIVVVCVGLEMSRYFNEDIINRIIESNDIVSLISEYVPLKKKGKNYWGCCPFHNEKTPSFSVAPDKGFFHCFGCKESGNVISFLRKYENLTYPEALERLAERANIPLPEEQYSAGQKEKHDHRQVLYEVNEMAVRFFHNCLMQTSMGKPGLDYLLRRGLSMETIKTFKLGFAPPNWDTLYEAFTKRGIAKDVLLDLGLCRTNEQGRVYDYFRNRVMFPIFDGKGRSIGFGGRVLDDSLPKYLNSPETAIFNKRYVLFAFSQAYPQIRQSRQAILMEGYVDVISAHNAGITNAIASLGTAFTKGQANLLLRQADEIVLAYDMDGAGRKAAENAISILQNTDFSVKVMSLPDGKDPDDYIKKHGPQAFQELVAQGISDFEFLLQQAMAHHDSNDSRGKELILQDLFPFVANERSLIRREQYIQSMSMALWMDETTVQKSFSAFVRRGKIEIHSEGNAAPQAYKSGKEEQLLSQMILYEAAWQQVMPYLVEEDFPLPWQKSIWRFANEAWEQQQFFTEQELLDALDDAGKEAVSRMIVLEEHEYDEERVYVLMQSLRISSLRAQLQHHVQQADALQRANDPRYIEELKRCQEIQALIREWSA